MKTLSEITGIFIVCRNCKADLLICRSCYRGQSYCNRACRDLGYKERRKAARLRYAASTEAKLDHRDRNRTYRRRRKYNEVIQKKSTTESTKQIVMDKGSAKSQSNLYSTPELTNLANLSCQICGSKISRLHKRRDDENLELFTFIPNRWGGRTD